MNPLPVLFAALLLLFVAAGALIIHIVDFIIDLVDPEDRNDP